jgi:tRNA-specific 2-thiouridylase
VGHEEELSHLQLTAKRVNWVSGMAPTDAFEAEIKIRYKSKSIPAWVRPLRVNAWKYISHTSAQDVTPGQGAIIYQGSQCLGGGNY